MTYDSRFIERRTTYDEYGNPTGNFWEFYGWRKKTPLGGLLTATKKDLTPTCTTYNPPQCANKVWQLDFTWVRGDGAKYKWTTTLQQGWAGGYWSPTITPAVYDNYTLETTDSEFEQLKTGTYFNPDAQDPEVDALIRFKDGSSHVIRKNNNWQVYTLNGNSLAVSGDSTSSTTQTGAKLYDVLPTSDTAGRTISYSGGSPNTITLLDTAGQQKTYSITWTTTTYDDSTIRVVSAIGLPNGKSYQFEYGGGSLTKVTFPSGGYLRYTYTTPPSGLPAMVASRIVSADGTSGSEKTWTYSAPLN